MIQKTIVFLNDVRSELSQVSWPTRGELWESTKVVLATMFLLAIILGIFDSGCAWLISRIVR